MKSKYTKPDIEHVGSVTDLTLGSSDGDFTDASFPEGTPRGDLTFS